MDFALSDDQQLLRGTARAFLDERVTPAVVRALWSDPRGERDDLWKELARLGWLGLALPEAHGGSGLGMVETAVVLEEMGRAVFPGPYLETVVAARAIEAAGTPAQQARWLPGIAAGDGAATVALLDADLDWRPESTADPGRADSGRRRTAHRHEAVGAVGQRRGPHPRAGAGSGGGLGAATWWRAGPKGSASRRCSPWIRGCAGRRSRSTRCRCRQGARLGEAGAAAAILGDLLRARRRGRGRRDAGRCAARAST